MQIGMNLLVWGARRNEDLPGVLREVATAGYDAVELRPPENPEAAVAALNANGIRVAAGHIGLGQLESALESHLDWLERTGARFLACSGPDWPTGAQYRAAGQRLERAGARCRQRGIALCYHNHAHEITHDVFGLGHLLAVTTPENVRLCMDTYWIARGGQDPAATLTRFADRLGFVHLKDMAPDRDFAEVGQGQLDWAAIRQAVEAAGVPLVMVEQDRTKRTPVESATLSRQYLRAHWEG